MSGVYTHRYLVGAGETDCFGHCRPSSLLYFLQDAATHHAQALQASREDLMESHGAIWLLTRQWFSLRRPLRSREELSIETWHRGPQGASFYRDFSLFCGDEFVGEALSVWVVADQTTFRVLRPSSLPPMRTADDPARARDKLLQKLSPPEQLAEAAPRMVRYSDLDINRHCNNVRYADMICDALELHRLPDAFVRALQINNSAECRAGEALTLRHGLQPNGVRYVMGCGPEGTRRFDAEITVDGG